MMTYPEAIDFLYSLELFGIKLGLENITKFLQRLDNPQNSFHAIHIAGTNGKGSVASIFESILMECGYSVGKFTSPHLYDFRERFHINKHKIDQEFVAEFISEHRQYIKDTRTTFFETCTGLAFEMFRRHKVDFAVVEVGLGGRLDATTLVNPDLTVITGIAKDHTKTLGDTIEKIAFEKCGIIKKGVPLVSGAKHPAAVRVIEQLTAERGAPLYTVNPSQTVRVRNIEIDDMSFEFSSNSSQPRSYAANLIGSHQAQNCAVALSGIEVLKKSGYTFADEGIVRGLKNVFWPARMQYVSGTPAMILDCAHNPDGMAVFVETIEALYPGRQMILLLGMLNRPDYPEIFELVKRISKFVVLTIPEHATRAPSEELLAREAIESNLNFKLIPQVLQAYNYAKELVDADELLLVTGSHFMLGEIMKSEKIPT